MNKNFIQACIKSAIYKRKAGTKTSHYRLSGDEILPNRLDMSFGNTFSRAANKGRMTTYVVGEIRGQFTKRENSPLKMFRPFKISSKIFRQVEFPLLLGWSDVAVSDEEGRCATVVGIAVFEDLGTDRVRITFMAGGRPMPDFVTSLCEFVMTQRNNK